MGVYDAKYTQLVKPIILEFILPRVFRGLTFFKFLPYPVDGEILVCFGLPRFRHGLLSATDV